MPRTCYVGGCDSGSRTSMKRIKEKIINHITLFRAPKQHEMLQKWQLVIPKSGKLFGKEDYVCEKHFVEEDVEKNYTGRVFDGTTTYSFVKGRVTLKPEAIPSIFLLKHPSIQIKNNIKEEPHSEDTNDILINDTLENAVTFSTKDFQNLQLPSKYWLFKIIGDKVGFICWSSDLLTTEKRVVLSSDLTLKVFIMEKQVFVKDMEKVQVIADISEILKRVQELHPCSGSNDKKRSDKCLHYVTSKTKSSLRCLPCKKHRQHLARKRKLKSSKVVKRLKNVVQRIVK